MTLFVYPNHHGHERNQHQPDKWLCHGKDGALPQIQFPFNRVGNAHGIHLYAVTVNSLTHDAVTIADDILLFPNRIALHPRHHGIPLVDGIVSGERVMLLHGHGMVFRYGNVLRSA